ncbi:MAG: ABC transporter ATP-binding protein [Geminicoccaceae bacterium]
MTPRVSLVGPGLAATGGLACQPTAGSEPAAGDRGPRTAVAFGQETILEVRNLGVEFRTQKSRLRVVDGVSFSIEKGRTVALVGESGSGKSVTSLAIMGLLQQPPAVVSGEIRFRDATGRLWQFLELSEKEMRAFRGDRVSMIFQEPMTSLNPVHTVGEQISEVLLIHRKMRRAERHRAAIRMLERVGIPEAERRAAAYPHELSGGMRQRVMIGMALACEPSLLIADEPTTALDVTIQAQILNDLKSLQREMGMAMLFVTHDLGVVSEVAHSVVVMYAGQVVESGPTVAILKSPRHPYTRALLASIPRANADRQQPLTAIPGTVPDLAHAPTGCRFHPRCSQAVPGRCDVQVPATESLEDGRTVRCLRWREL